jgi:hypothetical protein
MAGQLLWLVVSQHMTNPIASTSHTLPKLSQEPDFFSIDLSGPFPMGVRVRTAGLLAFLYVEGNQETVIKILMCEDLAKAFIEHRPFSGHANFVAYCIFPEVTDFDRRILEMDRRLQLYARLIEKYNAPQTGRAQRA